MESVLAITYDFNVKIQNFNELTCVSLNDRLLLNYDKWTELNKNIDVINNEIHDFKEEIEYIIISDLKITVRNIESKVYLFFEDDQPRLIMTSDEWCSFHDSLITINDEVSRRFHYQYSSL